MSKLITEIQSRLINRQPFFASHLLNYMTIEEFDKGIAATDGTTIWINPEEFRKMRLGQQMFILCHEIMHAVYGHLIRAKIFRKLGNVNGLPFSDDLMNSAEDFVINDALLHVEGLERPPMGLFDRRYNESMSAIQVYELLYKQQQSQPQQPKQPQQGEGEGGGTPGTPTGSKGTGFDEHVEPADGTPAPTEQEIKQRMVQAMNTAKAMGNMPGNLERIITGLVEPKVDWKEQLRASVEASLGKDNLSWSRPNRRKLAFEGYPIMPGRSGSRTGKLAVVVDTSGSVSQDEMTAFLGEIGGMLDEAHPEQCIVFWTDARVAGTDEVETSEELMALKPQGGGGTHMPAAYPEIEEHMGTEDVTCVVLTDGYTNWDDRPPFDMVVCSTTEHKTAPYGTNIYLEV